MPEEPPQPTVSSSMPKTTPADNTCGINCMACLRSGHFAGRPCELVKSEQTRHGMTSSNREVSTNAPDSSWSGIEPDLQRFIGWPTNEARSTTSPQPWLVHRYRVSDQALS